MLARLTLAKAALLFLAVAPVLAAAPGEPEATLNDVPHLAQAAIARRLNGADFRMQIARVKPSDNTPGYVACGYISDRSANQQVKLERFFVIVPGNFAVLERDNAALIDTYWHQNHC